MALDRYSYKYLSWGIYAMISTVTSFISTVISTVIGVICNYRYSYLIYDPSHEVPSTSK